VLRKDGSGAPILGFPDYVSASDKHYQATFYRWDGSKLSSFASSNPFSTNSVTALSLEYGPGNVGCYTEQQSGYGYDIGGIANGSSKIIDSDVPQTTLICAPSRHGGFVRLRTASGTQNVIVSYEASGDTKWTDYPTVSTAGIATAITVDALNRPIVAYAASTSFVMVRASMPLP
jgi:hypothetical protein